MANSHMISDFYSKPDSLMIQLGIKDMPDRFWNCDETGLSYVVKPNKVVTAIGKRYVYKRTYADRGETHTLLGCVCANGSWIPPLIIFKGVRWNDNLKTDCLPNCMVKLSPKGWINSDLFLEWFKFFIDTIPSERPVILFMDNAFKKSGICPLNKNAIPPEAIAPSQLTNRDIQSSEIQPHSITAIQTLLTVPSVKPTTPNPNRPKRDSSAKCLTPPDQPIPSTSKDSIPVCSKKSKKKKNMHQKMMIGSAVFVNKVTTVM